MDRTQSPEILDADVVVETAKRHPWATNVCRAWSVLCATFLALSVIVQIRRLALSASPTPASEVIAWICFDALFLLGAYAGYDLLCGARCRSEKCDSED